MADLNQPPKTEEDDFSYLDLPDDELGNYTPGSTVVNGAAGAVAVDEGAADAAAAGSADAGADDGVDAGQGVDAGEGGQSAEGAEGAGELSPKPAEGQAPAGEGEAAASSTDGTKQPVSEGQSQPKTEAGQAKEGEAKPTDQAAVDYKAEYERLLAPFKANGKDIAVQSVDDAITLMQMGANYNKKMAALKPNLALLKMLENNGLLSEDKLSFLIDLSKKDAGAINKLVQDSGLDPMDLDAAKAKEYKPGNHKVDTREVELDAVLDEIQTTPSYQRTLGIVTKEWDAASKQVIADSPQLLKVINGHVANGVYDLISGEIERERMLGRLTGVSDIQAYQQVGDAINARGGFSHLVSQRSQGQQQTPPAGKVVAPKPKVADDATLKAKKLAASPTKPVAPSAAAAQDFNPLAMSDEDFGKLVRPKFL